MDSYSIGDARIIDSLNRETEFSDISCDTRNVLENRCVLARPDLNSEAMKDFAGTPGLNIHIFTGLTSGTGAGIFQDVL